MAEREGNFRSRVFGGFDRRDVIDYIEQLARERNELLLENESLREKVTALEEKLSQAEQRAAEPEPMPEPMPEPEERVNEARAALDEALGEALAAVGEARGRYEAVCTDLRINVSQAEADLERLGGKLGGLRDALESADERFSLLQASLEERKKALSEVKD